MTRGYRILYHHRIRSDDGQAVHVRELIRALRAAGHEVCECALVPKASGAATMREAGAGARAAGLRSRVQLPRRAVELVEIAYGHTAVRRLLRAAETFRPDFVYERHALHCEAGLRAARRLGVPLLLEVNAPLADEAARLGRLRFPRRARRTERKVLSEADRVLAVTGTLRRMLEPCGASPGRTEVIGNAAEPERYGETELAAGRSRRLALGLGASAREGGRFVVGFIGFMRPWHRLELAVRLLLRPQLQGVVLMLVGDGPSLPAVLAQARELGVADRVVPLGAVTADEVPRTLGAFDAALVPAANEYASPLKIFDSLAAGVPTLAPRQPNIEETLRDGVDGLLFDRHESGSLERALSRLVADPTAAAALGAAGRRRLVEQDWTWAGNARRVIGHYEAVRAARVGEAGS